MGKREFELLRRRKMAVYIWNPAKYHGIVMQTYPLLGKWDFAYYPDGVPSYKLMLFGGKTIDNKGFLVNVLQTLVWLNPDITYEYYRKMTSDLLKNEDGAISSYFFISPEEFRSIADGVFHNRQQPKIFSYQKFFFNQRIYWSISEKRSIIATCLGKAFSIEKEDVVEGINKVIREKRTLTVTAVADEIGITYGILQKWLAANLDMREYFKLKKEEQYNKRNIPKLANRFSKKMKSFWNSHKRAMPLSTFKQESKHLDFDEEDQLNFYFQCLNTLLNHKPFCNYLKNVRNINPEDYLQKYIDKNNTLNY